MAAQAKAMAALDATVAVCTYGNNEWLNLARARAIPSAQATGARVMAVHDRTLHEARNRALQQASTPWIVYLDADDELAPDYFDSMREPAEHADVLVPSVQYLRKGRPVSDPHIPRVVGHRHECWSDCLRDGNFVVVGACARVHLLLAVGGWRDYPIYEDFDVWQRCWLLGAEFFRTPAAVYRAHMRPASRNRAMASAEKHRWHMAINDANGVTPTWGEAA